MSDTDGAGLAAMADRIRTEAQEALQVTSAPLAEVFAAARAAFNIDKP